MSGAISLHDITHFFGIIIVILISMKKKLSYIISTIALIIGLVILMHGSKLILHTYQLESMHVETLKTGSLPLGDHAQWVEKRGFDEGLFHILFLICGVAISILSCVYIYKIKKRKRI